jgi:Stigma-specific protein, Stig1
MARDARAHSLDELAKGLASGTLSRGRALRLLGAALLGGTLGSLGIGEAVADQDRCPQGQTRCGERCVDLKTNERHCGSCRNRCGSNQTCCKGRCVNLKTNERHCGSCSNRCPEGSECVGGVCQGSCAQQGGTPLTEGECTCAFTCGADVSQFSCQDNPGCVCEETTEGTGFCAALGGLCSEFTTCSSSSECELGFKCVVGTCLNENCDPAAVGFCVQPCPSITSSVGHAASRRWKAA